MRLFLYYTLHSLINQLRKLMKTWVLFLILSCGLIGGLIGYGAGTLSEVSENMEEPAAETIEAAENEFAFHMPEEVGTDDLIELAVSGVVLLVLGFEAATARKNAASIFLPGDVTMLFASPLKPQSVLMFRLGTQLSAALAGCIWMLFQLPNLILNAGMTLSGALGLIIAWGFLNVFGKFLQVLIFLLSSSSRLIRRHDTHLVIGTGLVILACFGAFYLMQGGNLLVSAVRFFNAPASTYIPVYGWLKGLIRAMLKGNLLSALFYAGLMAGACAVLVMLIYRIHADYYEDALKKTEETAARLEEINDGRVHVRKRKEKKGVAEETEMRGFGASVYYFKAMHIRRRSAIRGLFTKTGITYLLASAGLSVFLRIVAGVRDIIWIVLLLGVFVFYRSLGNEMNEDAAKPYFVLIPESSWKKLFFSLAGGCASCFLDVVPALFVSALILGASPWEIYAWLPVLVSVDAYASCIRTFMDLSIPESVGKQVKQMLMVMFMYFGLLPDIAIMAVGMTLKHTAYAGFASAALNLFLAGLFFSLAGMYRDPVQGKRIRLKESPGSIEEEKKIYSRIGFSASAFLAVSSGLQILLSRTVTLPEGNPWLRWVMVFAPIYAAGVPAALMALHGMKREVPVRKNMRLRDFADAFAVCIFLMYSGNILGIAVTSALKRFFDITSANAATDLAAQGSVWMRLVFMVILAPFFEEFIFRAQFTSRMRPYGETAAVVTGALMFGLFHGNLNQFFYASMIGLVLGYVYIRTGKLRYTVALHMMINFLGGIAGPELIRVTEGDMFTADGITRSGILLSIYICLLIGTALIGFVRLCLRMRTLKTETAEKEIIFRRGIRAAWVNPGMLLFTAGCLILFALSMI